MKYLLLVWILICECLNYFFGDNEKVVGDFIMGYDFVFSFKDLFRGELSSLRVGGI